VVFLQTFHSKPKLLKRGSIGFQRLLPEHFPAVLQSNENHPRLFGFGWHSGRHLSYAYSQIERVLNKLIHIRRSRSIAKLSTAVVNRAALDSADRFTPPWQRDIDKIARKAGVAFTQLSVVSFVKFKASHPLGALAIPLKHGRYRFAAILTR